MADDEEKPEETPEVPEEETENSDAEAQNDADAQDDADAQNPDADANADGAETEEAPADDASVQTPEFPDLKPNAAPVGAAGELNRLYDVEVTVAAELGRTSVPIQHLLGLSEGSVFELDRSISSPIELVAQGIPLGNGEVVVVDDSFAIRIKEIYANKS